MATVQAERKALDALRAYLLRALPAKVDAVNATRAARITAPRAGPYTLPGSASLALGTDPASLVTVALTAGVRTATQVAAELDAAFPGALVFGVDEQDRLYIQADAPSAGAKSVVALGADETGAAAAIGLPPGGDLLVRNAIVAPVARAIVDGEPGGMDFSDGFYVVFRERTSEPRSSNIRDDTHRVAFRAEVIAAEPDASARGSQEYLEACVRAVREVIYEDRTLDGLVMLAELLSVRYRGQPFYFAQGGQMSPLMTSAEMNLRILVFERS